MSKNILAKSDGVFTYSQIISSVDYNRIMTNEHLYISASDKFLANVICQELQHSPAEVVELGCGPGRILHIVRKAVPQATMSAIEADEVFARHAKTIADTLNIKIIIDNVETCKLNRPINVFYSQGFHHHVSKVGKTHTYLKNIYDHLVPGGIYVLSDEFLPNYEKEEEREEKVIIWYSHIIAHALLHGYTYLAQEEAKTLLDDLYEGRSCSHIKSMAQINFVLDHVSSIDAYARNQDLANLNKAIVDFQNGLENYYNLQPGGDITVDLSRHDYKICERVLRAEVEKVGFNIEKIKSFGPIKHIGAMSVYILRKS